MSGIWVGGYLIARHRRRTLPGVGATLAKGVRLADRGTSGRGGSGIVGTPSARRPKRRTRRKSEVIGGERTAGRTCSRKHR